MDPHERKRAASAVGAMSGWFAVEWGGVFRDWSRCCKEVRLQDVAFVLFVAFPAT